MPGPWERPRPGASREPGPARELPPEAARDLLPPGTARDLLPPGARHCFGCGDANPIGLQLDDIRREGDEVWATLHPRELYQSYPGVLHGGLSATALDEVMGYAAILLRGVWAATATMEVRYRARVPLAGALPLRAGITERRGRRLRAWARLLGPDQTVAVEATGLLVALPEAMAAEAKTLYGPLT